MGHYVGVDVGLVLAKGAKILRSVKGALESTSGEVAPQPVSAADPAPDEVQEVAHDHAQDLAPAPGRSENPDQDEGQPSCP